MCYEWLLTDLEEDELQSIADLIQGDEEKVKEEILSLALVIGFREIQWRLEALQRDKARAAEKRSLRGWWRWIKAEWTACWGGTDF